MPSKTKPPLSLEEIKRFPCQTAKIISSKTSQPFGTVVVFPRKKIGKHGILLFLLQVCAQRHTNTHQGWRRRGQKTYYDSVKATQRRKIMHVYVHVGKWSQASLQGGYICSLKQGLSNVIPPGILFFIYAQFFLTSSNINHQNFC